MTRVQNYLKNKQYFFLKQSLIFPKKNQNVIFERESELSANKVSPLICPPFFLFEFLSKQLLLTKKKQFSTRGRKRKREYIGNRKTWQKQTTHSKTSARE